MNKYYEELLKTNKDVISLISGEIKSSWIDKSSQDIGFIHDMFSLTVKNKYHKREEISEVLLNDFIVDISSRLKKKKVFFDKVNVSCCLPYFVDVKILNLVSENNLIFDLNFFVHLNHQKAYKFNAIDCGEISFYDKNAQIPVKYSFSSNSVDILISPSGYFVVNEDFVSISFEESYSYASKQNNKKVTISLKELNDNHTLFSSGTYTPDCLTIYEPLKSQYMSFFKLFENMKDINYNELKENILNPESTISQETKDLLLLKNDLQIEDSDSNLISMFAPPEANNVCIKLKGNVFDKISRLRHGFHLKKYYS